jgi:putative ABC transport system ATP-binding protein
MELQLRSPHRQKPAGAKGKTRTLTMLYQLGTTEVLALDSVNLFVPPGQFLIVRGRSGSGKTTLLHLLAGLQRATEGTVNIGGTQVSGLSANQADLFRRRHIGLIFQFFNLIPSLTVEMNVALPLLLEGQKLRHLRPRLDELLKMLGIHDRRSHAPHELSGGEMQRVAIARALIVNPKLILADEPTGNLDSRTSHEVFALLRDEAARIGATAVVMTHDTDVTVYADRVIEMADGAIETDTGPFPPREERPW